MTTTQETSPQYHVKFEGKIGKTLRAYALQHPHQIIEIAAGGGYSTERAGGFAYDALLRPGWSMSDDAVHTLIEPTVPALLAQLRTVAKCDCDNCKEEARDALAKHGHPIPEWLLERPEHG